MEKIKDNKKTLFACSSCGKKGNNNAIAPVKVELYYWNNRVYSSASDYCFDDYEMLCDECRSRIDRIILASGMLTYYKEDDAEVIENDDEYDPDDEPDYEHTNHYKTNRITILRKCIKFLIERHRGIISKFPDNLAEGQDIIDRLSKLLATKGREMRGGVLGWLRV